MKMTKIRQATLKRKLQESRSRLMENQPFFAILLMYLRFVAVDNIRNISTNGKCIFFNADFISKLYPNELDFILCHQIMHIINRDIWRGRSLAGDDFHRACDIYNNDQLIEIGWKVKGFTHFGKLQYKIPMYNEVRISDLTPYKIFKMLPYKLHVLDERTRRRYMADSDLYWDYKNSDYLDGIVILDIPHMVKYSDDLEMPEAELVEEDSVEITGKGKKKGIDGSNHPLDHGEEMEDFWVNQVGKAEKMIRKMGINAGTIPGGIRREIDKEKKRDIDWRVILDEFVQEEITDYSFTPPDRRYEDAGFFLPDFNEKDYIPKDILFMADTSGSINRDELNRVFAEISSAIEQFGGKLNGRLGFFDCEVIEPIPFESIEEIDSIVPYGGGGTSFHIIFDYIREHLADFVPTMVVIFTDGYASFPEQEAAMNIPVLWLISNEHVTPPWGKVGRVIT